MIIYAHRGWHDAATPENSMAAFARAADAGHGVETDLRTDRAGRIILFHDRTVGGAPVDRLDLAEIRQRTGRPVPTLDDLLGAGFAIPLNLEVKTSAAWTALQPYVACGLPDDVLLSSFVHAIPAMAAAAGLDAALLLASSPAVPDDLPRPQPRLSTIVWDFNVAAPALLEAARAIGWRNVVYGARTRDEHRLLAAGPCDAVITDWPDRVFPGTTDGPMSSA